MFLIPFLLPTVCAVLFCWTVCAIAAVAALEEMILHLRQKTYDANVKSLYQKEART